MKVGYIGLGNMGAPIARRLARSGFEVIACDIAPKTLAAFDEPGTEREADPIETARKAEALGVCVRTDAQLEQLAGDGRLFAALGEGGLFFLNSTVSPELARRLAAEAEKAGIDFVDVGVSGGAGPALDGKLSLFVGANERAFERAKPLLQAIGKTITRLGAPGRGQEGKLVNNLVSIAHLGLAAAILDLGDRLNFDRDKLREGLLAGSAESFALRVVSNMLEPQEAGDGYYDYLHDLLEKDIEHASHLAPGDDPGMAALLGASRSILGRIRRAAAETA